MAVLDHEVSSDPYGRCCSMQCDRSDYLSEFGCPVVSPGIHSIASEGDSDEEMSDYIQR
jgi:hypothetical protein